MSLILCVITVTQRLLVLCLVMTRYDQPIALKVASQGLHLPIHLLVIIL